MDQEGIPLSMVHSKEDLDAMCHYLATLSEVSVHAYREEYHSYWGFLCVIVIGTKEKVRWYCGLLGV